MADLDVRSRRTVYFCDRFRRYKFVGEAGALALLQGMCTKNDTNLEANASLFSKVRSTQHAEYTQSLRAQAENMHQEMHILCSLAQSLHTECLSLVIVDLLSSLSGRGGGGAAAGGGLRPLRGEAQPAAPRPAPDRDMVGRGVRTCRHLDLLLALP